MGKIILNGREYAGGMTALNIHNSSISSHPDIREELDRIASKKTDIEVGETLYFDINGKLNVRTAPNAEKDNTLPITSAAVETIVGNISVLLQQI